MLAKLFYNHSTFTGSQSILARYEPVIRRSLLFVAVFTLALKLSSFNASRILDPDLWWHLRTGQWIMDHHAVPTTESYSIVAGTGWIAYSWLYEIIMYGLYSLFGLSGVVIYGMAMAVAITIALYGLLYSVSGRIALSFGLTALGLVAMAGTLATRSFMFSILFFILELRLLQRLQNKDDLFSLVALPCLFALWANFHIQFVYGLLLYAIVTLGMIIDSWWPSEQILVKPGKTRVRKMIMLGFLCVLATLVTPYHVAVYEQMVKIWRQPVIYSYISELQAPSFRHLDEWAGLFLVLAAAFVAGWRRMLRQQATLLLLLAIAVVLGFRSYRDIWFPAVIGLTTIAPSYAVGGTRENSDANKPLVGLGMLSMAILVWNYWGISNQMLGERLAKKYPMAAADFVAQKAYAGPLFNDFDWGGFLLWKLPDLPVSIYGCTLPFSGERFERQLRTWRAKPGWQDDPDLLTARTIIANPEYPLSSVLRLDPKFKLVYEDETALVFVPVDTAAIPPVITNDAAHGKLSANSSL